MTHPLLRAAAAAAAAAAVVAAALVDTPGAAADTAGLPRSVKAANNYVSSSWSYLLRIFSQCP